MQRKVCKDCGNVGSLDTRRSRGRTAEIVQPSLTKSMRSFVLCVLALTVSAGCRHEADQSPSSSTSPYRAADFDYSSRSDLLRHDFGTGILFLTEPPGGRYPRSDTIAIHASPDPTSRVKALFVFDQPDPNMWSYQVWSPEPDLHSNVLEFAYEVSGVPLDSLEPGGWARAVYARDSLQESRKGWVELPSGRVGHLLWRNHLPERSLYVVSPETTELFEAPEREPLAIPLGDDHALTPMRVEGDWMQVRVATPSVCGAAPGEEIREAVAWIRYLQPDGRPRVWYSARGC